LYFYRKYDKLLELNVQLIGQEEVTEDIIQLKRKEIHDAKDTQLREVLNYQGKIEKLQHQVDQMQGELESSRKSQLAEVEALTQTKDGLVQQLEGMAK